MLVKLKQNKMIKPIAMRCNASQYEEIKPLLLQHVFAEQSVWGFDQFPYLLNHWAKKEKGLGLASKQLRHLFENRTVFETWNKDIFLEYCDIKPEFVLPEKWCVEDCKEVAKYASAKWNIGEWVSPNIYHEHHSIKTVFGNGWGFFEKIQEGFTLITLEQFKTHVLKQNSQTMQTLTLGQLKDLYNVSDCSKWQSNINWYLKHNLLQKDDFKVEIKSEDIKLLLKEGTLQQQNAVEKLGIKLSTPIEWDKIKTGSKVMLKYSGEKCVGSNDNIDFDKPFDVIFFKQPYYMFDNGFKTCNSYNYCTFNQNGKFACYQAHRNTDYITKVIEY